MNLFRKNISVVLDKLDIDAFLVTKSVNIAYLTGFPCEDAWLLISSKKLFYITDARYTSELKKNLKKGIEIVEYSKSMFVSVFDLALQLRIKRLGFDDQHISVFSFQKLRKAMKRKVNLIPVDGLIEQIRMVKTRQEVRKIDKSIALNLKCYEYLKRIIRPGVTEQEILIKLERYVKSHNAEFSFRPIIASGPNSCFPHARITNREIRRGEPIVVDMGIDIDGYKSDLTRVFFLGKIPQSIRDVYHLVREAQRLAIQRIKPGVLIRDIDQQARNFLKENKIDKFFVHSLGHGVGLEVHEAPVISSKNLLELKAGMVFTVEPGVYFPGQFGIRIEDMVLVTSSGCRILSE
ncbi:MAG: Xaa-Pro peptidase family protein [Candidatus Omnitrophica bacterium]|nr:Xaa-Pro peptidase family protein [Candidatus Omnitrophota bacterium]